MSQAGIINTQSGPVPPAVPTSFDLDIIDATISSVSASSGSAIPVVNHLRITGDNGISTVALPNVPGAFEIRFSRGETITVGAVTNNSLTLPVFTGTCLTLQIIVAGFADNNDAIGGYGTVTVKNIGGVSSLVGAAGPIDLLISADASLAAATITVTVAGANLLVNVKGVAGRTIAWTTVLPGIVSA